MKRPIPTPGESHLSKIANQFRPKERERFESDNVDDIEPDTRKWSISSDGLHRMLAVKRPERSDRVDGLHSSPNRGWHR